MEKKPYIGELNRVISVVKKEIIRTDTGSEKSADVVVCAPYAKMTDVSGNEDVDGKVVHLVNRTYIIRRNEEVKALSSKLTVIDEGKRYEVIHAKEIGKTHLELIVRLYE